MPDINGRHEPKMRTIEINEETRTGEEIAEVLDRVAELIREGYTSGYEPSWELVGIEEDEETEEADNLIEEGTAMLDALAKELEKTDDAPAQRQALNDALDGWTKDNSAKMDDLNRSERLRVDSELSDHCASLHK